ncbi:hypothetical protein [Sporosarcina sp. P17b]|uniref:hypothetical protein n=1 Tax=Sporosarcina sp. P17b TaxID=2048260 RepID=UPI000C16ADCF|nr:hypothetical protein [Sporosarcina sp. P17b]PIC72872.1 hypothetical protein CSV76_12780 [Sporosarcina sp. P17b]
MISLIQHTQKGNFNHFVMKGEKGKYHITVIQPPLDFHGEGWGRNEYEGHYVVINNDRNTRLGSCHSYNFVSSYFTDSSPDYLPYRIGIHESCWEDFMNCSREFIYPIVKSCD